jgi:hypothetical protein
MGVEAVADGGSSKKKPKIKYQYNQLFLLSLITVKRLWTGIVVGC